MMKCLLIITTILINSITCVEIHCKFSTFDYFTVGKVYTCAVEQKRDALHHDSEVIKVFGDHGEKKKNSDVIAVRVHSRMMATFPSNFEKFFTNLKVIQVYASGLKVITQKDLEPFTKLHHIDLSKNDLEIIPRELFKFNTELLVIKISENKLKFIDANAFDTLYKLHTLELNDNHCIWKSTQSRENWDEEDEIDRDDVINVMYEARNRCYRDFILKELHDMEMGKFLKERSEIVVNLETRIGELREENEMFYNKMREYKNELDICKMEEIRMGKAPEEGEGRNSMNSSSTPIDDYHKPPNNHYNYQKPSVHDPRPPPPPPSNPVRPSHQQSNPDQNFSSPDRYENRFDDRKRPQIEPNEPSKNLNPPEPDSTRPKSYLPLNNSPPQNNYEETTKKRPQSGIPMIIPLEPNQLPKTPSSDFNRNYLDRNDEKSTGYSQIGSFDTQKVTYETRFNRDENRARDGDEKYMLRSQEQHYGQQWNNWGKKNRESDFNYNWRY